MDEYLPCGGMKHHPAPTIPRCPPSCRSSHSDTYTEKKNTLFHFFKNTMEQPAALYHGCDDKAKHNFSRSKPPVPHDPQARSDRRRSPHPHARH